MEHMKLTIPLLIKSMNWHHTWPDTTKTQTLNVQIIIKDGTCLIRHLIDCIQNLSHHIDIDLLADGDCFRFAGPMERCQAEVELLDRENSTYLVRHRSKECTEYALSIK